MKKIISLLCVLAVTVGIISVGVLSAAAEVPTTEVEVKSGDKVTYVLELGDCNEKVVGCDFSIYFDENVLKVESVADFNNSTNDEDWSATINPSLPGEVRGNWSILKGVDFSKKRNFITVNFSALKDAKTHLSYFIRYMYGNSVFDSDSRPQMAQYTFTCNVTVDGKAVVENAQPELNVEETQPNGLFENSRTGKSDDADAALSGDSLKKNGGANDGNGGGSNSNNGSGNDSGNNSGNNSGNGGSSSGSDQKSDSNKSDNKSSDSDKKQTQTSSDNKNSGGSSDDKTIQTDADGKLAEGATVAASGSSEKKSGGSLMWVIIAAVVLIAGGSIAYVAFKGKKSAAPAVDEPKSDDKKTDDAKPEEKKSDEPADEPVKEEPVTTLVDKDEPVTELADKEDK